MGNHHSYDKDTIVRHLWKALHAIPVLPINLNLAPLRVLQRDSDGYHDVGSVYSLCKQGADKIFLRGLVKPTFYQTFFERHFTTESIGSQTCNILNDHGAIAKLFFWEANAATWFSRAKSVNINIQECWVREFNIENWDEMLQRFDPDMSKAFLEKPDRKGRRKLIIVQKVLLVSQVQITASYKTTAGLNFNLPEVVPGSKLQTEVTVEGAETVLFTLSATERNQKFPIAFSGLQYTYDKFGFREPKQGTLTRNQPDMAARMTGDSSSHDEDTAANDGGMGDFFEDEDDWYISIISSHDHDEEDDDPAPDPASPSGSPPRDLEKIN